MTASYKVEITEYPEHGVVLKCCDIETADQLEDFLTESRFVLFNTGRDEDGMLFYFGQAGSISKVEELYKDFCEAENKKQQKGVVVEIKK
jgi:hypothetical protein